MDDYTIRVWLISYANAAANIGMGASMNLAGLRYKGHPLENALKSIIWC